MMRERLAAILDAYGASPERWPVAERTAAEELVASDSQARMLANDARRIDDALDSAVMMAVSADLHARILASFDRIATRPSVKRLMDRMANIVWPGAPLWQPSAAIAVSLIAGLVLGVLSPVVNTTRTAASDMTAALDAPADPDDGM